jgi:hypothetical protein
VQSTFIEYFFIISNEESSLGLIELCLFIILIFFTCSEYLFFLLTNSSKYSFFTIIFPNNSLNLYSKLFFFSNSIFDFLFNLCKNKSLNLLFLFFFLYLPLLLDLLLDFALLFIFSSKSANSYCVKFLLFGIQVKVIFSNSPSYSSERR